MEVLDDANIQQKSDELDVNRPSVHSAALLPYHFPCHSIICVDREPLCVCLAEDRLLVATVGHCVEVRDLDAPGRVRHAFSTVDLVKQIVYSKTGKYVATLEVKTSRHSLMTHVRVYMNWQQAVGDHADVGVGDQTWLQQPMRARIAGRVTPSSQADVGQLEMVELPLRRQPTLTNVNAANVNCCPATGNLVVACGFTVSIFRLCVKVHDISRLQFQDLEHLMDVHFVFPIKEVALCEDYLACASASEVHVVRIRFRCARNSTSSISSRVISVEEEEDELERSRHDIRSRLRTSHSATEAIEEPDVEDDAHFIEWDCSRIAADETSSTSQDFQGRLHESLAADSWPLTIHLPSLKQQQSLHNNSVGGSREIFGPAEYFPGHPVQIEYTGILDGQHRSGGKPGGGSHVTFEPISLLHRRFPISLIAAQRFCLHSLQFFPLYVVCKDTDVVPNNGGCEEEGDDDEMNDMSTGQLQLALTSSGNPLQSRRHNRLRRLEVFFSTQKEGFMYDVLSVRVKQTSRFPYAIDSGDEPPVCQAFLEASALHAVSASGVKTYSLDNWNFVFSQFHSIFPVALEIDHRVRLLGSHRFLNVRHAAYGDGNLVLLTNASSDSSENVSDTTGSWTAYILQCAPAEFFYKDLVETSMTLKSSDRGEDVFAEHQAAIVLATEMLVSRPPATSCLARLFCDACCHLGDTYLMRARDNDHLVAVAFYDVSGAPLETVLEKILCCYRSLDDKSRNSVASILKHIFVDKYLSRLGVLSQETANAVVDVFVKNNSSFLADIFLNEVFRGHDNGSALELMVNKLESSKYESKDILATCLLSLETGNVSQISKYFAMLTNENLLELTCEYPNIWFQRLTDDMEDICFSQLMQLVQQLNPNAFVKLLQQLISLDHISSKLVRLLCQADWEDVGLVPRTDIILLSFLEEFLTNKSLRSWHCAEATTTLVTLYLRCLADVEPKRALPSHVRHLSFDQSKPWSLFGPRQAWLNELPPFLGRSMHDLCELLDNEGELKTDGVEDDDCKCPCVACNDCLLRLQSLLCNPEVASLEVRYHVASTTSAAPDTLSGILSLRTLCSPNVINAARLLIPTRVYCRPLPLLEYGRQTFRHDQDLWQSLLYDLLATRESLADEDELRIALDVVINGVVSHLAESLLPDHLVSMLPPADCARFTPHVRRSITRLRSKQLHDVIVAKGNELKAIV